MMYSSKRAKTRMRKKGHLGSSWKVVEADNLGNSQARIQQLFAGSLDRQASDD